MNAPSSVTAAAVAAAAGLYKDLILIFELKHDKTTRMNCEPIKDSDQPRHPPCLISLHKDPNLLQADREDTDQTGWMHRLI